MNFPLPPHATRSKTARAFCLTHPERPLPAIISLISAYFRPCAVAMFVLLGM